MSAKLIYSALTSLDGYVVDATGRFDWAAPDEEVHAAVNDLVRNVGTQLYGRRMYEVVVAWESDEMLASPNPVIADFARLWRSADKIIYSRSLERASSARTRIERAFDPDAIRRLKETADRDLSIGGPELAGQALRAGLVDEIHLFLNQIVVGGGTAALPDGFRVPLQLIAERRFASGVVHVGYRVRGVIVPTSSAVGDRLRLSGRFADFELRNRTSARAGTEFPQPPISDDR